MSPTTDCKCVESATRIFPPGTNCERHVFKIAEPCPLYDVRQEFCPEVYRKYCREQGSEDCVNKPCSLCYRRPRKALDCFGVNLIFIKAKAGCGTSTEHEDRITGFWPHAIFGQLYHEEHVWKPIAIQVGRANGSLEAEDAQRKARLIDMRWGEATRAAILADLQLPKTASKATP